MLLLPNEIANVVSVLKLIYKLLAHLTSTIYFGWDVQTESFHRLKPKHHRTLYVFLHFHLIKKKYCYYYLCVDILSPHCRVYQKHTESLAQAAILTLLAIVSGGLWGMSVQDAPGWAMALRQARSSRAACTTGAEQSGWIKGWRGRWGLFGVRAGSCVSALVDVMQLNSTSLPERLTSLPLA